MAAALIIRAEERYKNRQKPTSLFIDVGDRIEVIGPGRTEEWAKGKNLETGRTGVFPIDLKIRDLSSNEGSSDKGSSAEDDVTDMFANIRLDHPPPFDGASGEWVERDDFMGEKSFGRFECGHCRKKWTSAHAFKDFSQGCNKCDTKCLPCCLWMNFEQGDSEDRDCYDNDDNNRRPHDSSRCEACSRGRCLL